MVRPIGAPITHINPDWRSRGRRHFCSERQTAVRCGRLECSFCSGGQEASGDDQEAAGDADGEVQG
jgi:hypothetical protein